jgi:hypothetical protein
MQTQSSQSATVTIGGPSFGYPGPTDILVYWDTVYRTFMFAFSTEPASAMGSIIDQLGKPGQGKLSVEGKDFNVSVGKGVPKAGLRLT